MIRLAVLLACLAGPVAAQLDCSRPQLGAFWGETAPCFRVGASYGDPTERYPHAILGDGIEYGSLTVELEMTEVTVTLPEDRVFEDLEPRLVQLDGEGLPEIVVIESSATQGAQLAVYRARFPTFGAPSLRKIAATPPIGQRFRWLAPVAAADLDGDGHIELAYVDRPHLAKVLRIWRFRDGDLTEIAEVPGLTNHRIGQDFITGGLRTCDAGPELVTANADWSRIMGSSIDGGRVITRDLGPFGGPASVAAALDC